MNDDPIQRGDAWRTIALHALSDLQMLGVDVSLMLDVGPDELEELAIYQRGLSDFS